MVGGLGRWGWGFLGRPLVAQPPEINGGDKTAHAQQEPGEWSPAHRVSETKMEDRRWKMEEEENLGQRGCRKDDRIMAGQNHYMSSAEDLFSCRISPAGARCSSPPRRAVCWLGCWAGNPVRCE